jgi:hypothetical protein
VRVFLERDKYRAENLSCMLYKTYTVSGIFKQNDQLSWDDFEAITMKETNDLVRRIYWELDGLVLDVQESKQ